MEITRMTIIFYIIMELSEKKALIIKNYLFYDYKKLSILAIGIKQQTAKQKGFDAVK